MYSALPLQRLILCLIEGPKILVTFNSGCKEGEGDAPVDGDVRPQKFVEVLQGLADCLACSGNGILVCMLLSHCPLPLYFFQFCEFHIFGLSLGNGFY